MNRNRSFRYGTAVNVPVHAHMSKSYIVWDSILRVVAAMALITLVPLMLPICICLCWVNKGPIFFKQLRPGYKGKLFTIYKLQTMKTGAESKTTLGVNESSSHVTKIGRVLRRLKIDEFPQLLNVVKGDMSVVGPRPIPQALDTELSKKIEGFYMRYDIKPGLTSIGQVCITDNSLGDKLVSDWKLRFEGELHYCRNITVGHDIILIIMTIMYIFKKK